MQRRKLAPLLGQPNAADIDTTTSPRAVLQPADTAALTSATNPTLALYQQQLTLIGYPNRAQLWVMATVQEFTISATLWARLAPLLPVHVPTSHPLGSHRPRIADRVVLNAIFFVLRTGCQWKALDATGLCKGSTAHSRFQQCGQAGVFARLWDEALGDYNDLIGLNFSWMALDGSLPKAPLGGEKNGPQSNGPRQNAH